eukprot:COSAG01_NODE_1807_length_9189_cov_24.677778_6_plen_83_part_00
MARLAANSQGVLDPLQPGASSQRKGDVLLAPADFNHSCTPNTTVAFQVKREGGREEVSAVNVVGSLASERSDRLYLPAYLGT